MFNKFIELVSADKNLEVSAIENSNSLKIELVNAVEVSDVKVGWQFPKFVCDGWDTFNYVKILMENAINGFDFDECFGITTNLKDCVAYIHVYTDFIEISQK